MEWSCVLLVYPCLLPFPGHSGQEFHAKDSFSFDVTVMNQLWHPRGGGDVYEGEFWEDSHGDMMDDLAAITHLIRCLELGHLCGGCDTTLIRLTLNMFVDTFTPPYNITPLISICKTNGMGEWVHVHWMWKGKCKRKKKCGNRIILLKVNSDPHITINHWLVGWLARLLQVINFKFPVVNGLCK